MTIVISLLSEKGGVTKTTTSWELGNALKIKGFKVLSIDLDQQGNLSYVHKADPTKKTIFNVLSENESIEDSIQHTDYGDIVASSPNLSIAGVVLQKLNGEYVLKNALKTIKKAGEYDFIIVDTPPALGTLTVNALTASDFVIVPVEPDTFSLQALGTVSMTVEAVKKVPNPNLIVLGVMITFKNGQSTNLGKHMVGMIESTAASFNSSVFETKISKNISIAEALAFQTTIFEHAPKSKGAIDYMNFTDEVLDRIKKQKKVGSDV